MKPLSVKELYFSTRQHFWRPHTYLLNGVDFELDEGECLGLLGHNAAGKTTTIKAILGLIQPDKGSIYCWGQRMPSVALRSKIGYMPESAVFPEALSGYELLQFYGKIGNIDSDVLHKEVHRVAEMAQLSDGLQHPIFTYSKGMRQRLNLAQALLGSPRMLILDEPFNALDPHIHQEVRHILAYLHGQGTSILLISHTLEDIERLCQRVVVLFRGKTQNACAIDALPIPFNRLIEIDISTCPTEFIHALQQQEMTFKQVVPDTTLGVYTQKDVNQVIDIARAFNISILRIHSQQSALATFWEDQLLHHSHVE